MTSSERKKLLALAAKYGQMASELTAIVSESEVEEVWLTLEQVHQIDPHLTSDRLRYLAKTGIVKAQRKSERVQLYSRQSILELNPSYEG